MAHSLSAKKRIRQNIKQRGLNRARRAVLRKRLRSCREALGGGDAVAAERSFRDACKALDREASRGILHRKAAARRKSRLAKHMNAMKAASSAPGSA
ncbi:MAG: 30S ribosomal protein S20 [Planctomycetes bacterium]|nr:30S ribosomal protein S20 [Planctomycetota bacterium]